MANRWGNNGNSDRLYLFIFLAPKLLQMVTAAMKLKDAYSLEKSYDQPRQHIKKQRHYFANKGLSCQGYGFSSGHVWMWEFDYKENWVPKNLCFWTVVLEEMLESPLDCKEIQSVHPKGSQSWVFTGRADAEAETPVLWPPDEEELFGKTLMQERLKAEGEVDDRGWNDWMASLTQLTWVWVTSRSWWWTGKPGVLQSRSCKESDMTEHLNWTELNWNMEFPRGRKANISQTFHSIFTLDSSFV